jgi:hypothetical protein
MIVTSAASCLAADGYVPEVYSDPLRWDDLVVRGTVKRIEHGTIPANDWFTMVDHDGAPVEVTRLTLSVDEMMRGDLADSDLVLTYPRIGSARDELIFNERISVGATVMATASHMVLVSRETIWRMMHIFVRAEGGWSHYEYRYWSPPIADSEVSHRVESVALPAVVKNSDLIVEGTVVSRREVGPPGDGEWEYRVRPAKVVKGTAEGDITFRAMRHMSLDESQWRRFLGYELEEGATCYFFLKKSGQEFAPACASTSVWRVRDDRVLRMNDAPTGYRTESFERDIARFAAEKSQPGE